MIRNPFSLSLLLTSALSLGLSHLAHAQEAPNTEVEEVAENEARQTTVVVRGQFIPEPQQTTSQVATFLSAEDLERQGDANIALALTRLSGLSVVGERFAYVRGLGDRYSAALLNGSPLPSPEPLRRTVPLDLFPSNVIGGATVQKTYSAKYPGEFGGGIIDIRTLRTPRENYFNVKYGVGYNTETTGSNGLFYRGSDSDWTGYDDGLRDVPSQLAAALDSGRPFSAYNSVAIEGFGESLVNSPLSVIQDGEVGTDNELEIDGGMSLDFGENTLGLIGVFGYDQSWTTVNAKRAIVSSGVLAQDFDVTETSMDVTVNGLGSATLELGSDHRLQALLFYVHDTTKEAQISTGDDTTAPGNATAWYESTGWYERQLVVAQANGEHIFGPLEINWRGSLSQSTRDAPYERTLERFIRPGETVPAYTDSTRRYRINFSELTDDVASFGADANYTFELDDARTAKFSAGFDTSSTEREYLFTGLFFVGGNSIPEDVRTARPDFLFSPDNIDPNRFQLLESPTSSDNYVGELDIMAGYAEADVELTPFIQTTLGVRYETAEQVVQTFSRLGDIGPSATLDNEYWLPAATFTWNFADDLQFRLAYSQTIARPQFRELAPSLYFDPETDRSYRGSQFLVDSELTNYDARLEYYFGRNQFVTLAGFYKEIDKPIEEARFIINDSASATTFINSPSAELYGAEFEYRTRFDIPLEGQFFADREVLFSINYTYTSSEVSATAGDTVANPFTGTQDDATLFGIDGSALQGTPENIVNVQLGWESDAEQLTLLIGWVDERIVQRGVAANNAFADVIEDPGIQLDLVYRRDVIFFGRSLTLGLSGRNLLNEAHEEYQLNETGGFGRTEYNTYDRGSSFSASLTAKF